MSNLLKTLLLPLVVALAASVAAYGNVTVSARLDSAVLLMGKQTALHIEVLQSADVDGSFLNERADTLTQFVEVVGRTDGDTVDLGNNRIQINRDWILQSFDSGLYVLPPMQYIVGSDTFRSSGQLTLKVVPVNVDTLSNIHSYKPVEGVPFHLLDYLPDFLVDYWWIFLLIIVIAALGVAGYMLMTKKKELAVQLPVLMPPYEEAMVRLEELKGRQLWQSGQEKAYYTELTDILRNYIDRRFGINAMEMTSSEIIAKLLEVNDKDAIADLRSLFETADLVKFAKHNPLMNENDANLINAIDFINETKVQEDDNAKPQPTEITVIEKRSLRMKILLGVGIVILSIAVIASLIYIGTELYSYFA